VAGQQLNNLSENRLTKWRGIHIGIVFRFFQLLPWLSLGHNVILPMDFTGIRPPSERVARYGTCKAKNLARDPRCVFTVATHDFEQVFEGEAVKVADEVKLNPSQGPTQRVGSNRACAAALFTPSTTRRAVGRLPGTSTRSRPRPCPPRTRPNRRAKLACAFNHNSWR
jgi:ABC-type taurine transport system ATPase subunit